MRELPSAAIFDMDGTLTRRRFGGESWDTYKPEIYDPAARTPYEWHRVGEDPPNMAVIMIAQALFVHGLNIIVVSGRSDACIGLTAQWLKQCDVPAFELHMATADESSAGVSDVLVKQRIYTEHIRDRWSVRIVFDDRDQVVAYWRSLGITCAQVGRGDF